MNGGDYNTLVKDWYPPYKLGVYSIGGGERHVQDTKKLCEQLGPESQSCIAMKYAFLPEMISSPLKSLDYFMINGAEKRF